MRSDIWDRRFQSMADNMKKLMDDIVKEQEDKRKSEMSALQSQINPHFAIIRWILSYG